MVSLRVSQSVLIACLTLTIIAPSARAQVTEQDSLALVALYNSTNGPGWTDNSSWLTGPASSWFGVEIN